MFQQFLIRLGPMLLSAFFLLCTSLITQYFLHWYDPTLSLLANRGAGKIIFTLLVIGHFGILAALQSVSFRHQWLETNVYFFRHKKWLLHFLTLFCIFFILHCLLLGIFFALKAITYQPTWICTWSTVLSILFGFIVTFFLAWTEELIFRGTIYPFFAQYYRPLTSAIITSFIFMCAHDITRPWNLVSTEWKLGLGLFLLGMVLNLLFCVTQKLSIGMGAHAGLVFVKVILRRVPAIKFLPPEQLLWGINQDLRQSLIVHICFLIAIGGLIMRFRKNLLNQSCHPKLACPLKPPGCRRDSGSKSFNNKNA